MPARSSTSPSLEPAGATPPAFIPRFLARPADLSLLILCALVLFAVLWLGMLFPRSVTPATARPDVFSGERAMAHLPAIAKEPHPAESPAQARVRDYLVQRLSASGLEVQVQKAYGLENVVARLRGSDPTGAIVVLAHYDSVPGSPGAGDNGSGVATLLETMRALAAGPAPRNDVIALFDDAEELPDPFSGTKAFVREHPWMADVRVAISLDTAVAGPVSTNETGPNNGWLVQALARAHTGGAWTSISGGGGYDYTPFRDAGIQGLVLESNYPFIEQHTPNDVAGIVNAGSVQQMGEQTLAIARELGQLDLGNPWGPHETWFPVPLLGLGHYPETWALPLAIAACVLFVVAWGLALWRRLATWRGLAAALGVILLTAVLAGAGMGALWARLPRLLGWRTAGWPEWPEVIPPNGWLLFVASGALVLALALAAYALTRRWISRAEFCLAGLAPFTLFAVALSIAIPRAGYLPTWIVLTGSLGWIMAGAGRKRAAWLAELAIVLEAVAFIVFLLPMLPGTFMGDGTKSLAILAGVWAWLLGVVLTTVDALIVRAPKAKPAP